MTGRSWRLYAVLAGLYAAQAIPSYLFAAAIPPILRENGVSRSAIGLLSILLLPLVLKFLWAPLVDRVRPFALGHRRAWILPTQLGVVLGIAGLAFTSPTNLWAIFLAGMAISLLASTQDIATDGYAAKNLDDRARPIGNAIQGGSVAFGVVVGGTLSLVLYDRVGWTATLLTIAALAAIPLLALIGMRADDPAPPPVGSRRVRPSLGAFFRRRDIQAVIAVSLIYRASEGWVKAMEAPYLVDRGLQLDQIGFLSGASAATAGLAGSAIAAVLVRRYGARGALVLLGGLRTICFLIFALHALDMLGGIPPLIGAAAFQTLIRFMEIVALYSLFMSVVSPDQPGTDFTTLSCLQLLVYLVGSSTAGVIADLLGYGPLFCAATLLSGLAVVATAQLLRDRRQFETRPGT